MSYYHTYLRLHLSGNVHPYGSDGSLPLDTAVPWVYLPHSWTMGVVEYHPRKAFVFVCFRGELLPETPPSSSRRASSHLKFKRV